MYDELTLGHDWVAGAMYVHAEDLEEIAKQRAVWGGVIECQACDATYPTDGRCPAASE